MVAGSTPEPPDEATRVRAVYGHRAERGLDSRYDYWEPANLFMYQSRERVLLAALSHAGLLPLTGRTVLDAGCGSGAVLMDMLRYGARSEDLCGIDLLPERVERARSLLPGADIKAGDIRSLPYESGRFDLVLAFTLFSSALDETIRRQIASEIGRVAKPGGLVLIYDFWTNPFNREARPVRREDVRRLFPGRPMRFRGATLAPPVVRALAKAPGGWLACSALQVLPFLQTHYLAAVHM